MPCQLPSLFDDSFEVRKGDEGFVRVPMVVTDLLQDCTKKDVWTYTVALSARAAVILWFPFFNADCHVITWYGPSTSIVGHVGVASKITCLRHGHVDEGSGNPGWGAAVRSGILPCKIRLL